MPANVITVYEDSKVVTVSQIGTNTTVTVNESQETEVVTIGMTGLQGPIGPVGPAGSPTDWMDDDGTVPSILPLASGSGSIAIGFDSLAVGANSYSQGTEVRSTGDFSHARGYQSNTHGIHGAEAFASGDFDTIGDAQRAQYILRGVTNDANTLFLTTNNSAALATNTVALTSDEQTIFYDANVIGRYTGSTDEVMAVKFHGVIDRNIGIASTAFLGYEEKVILTKDNTAWEISTEANVANGALQIYVNGQAGKTIRWLAQISTVEITN
jgi:hypothetical protein